MTQTKPSVRMLFAPMAVTLLMGLAGCAAGYVDEGPDWDGTVIVGGVYGRGGYDHRGYDRGGYDRDQHAQVFHAEGGGHPVGMGSDRGRASMGARAGGGGGHSGGGGGGGGHK